MTFAAGSVWPRRKAEAKKTHSTYKIRSQSHANTLPASSTTALGAHLVIGRSMLAGGQTPRQGLRLMLFTAMAVMPSVGPAVADEPRDGDG